MGRHKFPASENVLFFFRRVLYRYRSSQTDASCRGTAKIKLLLLLLLHHHHPLRYIYTTPPGSRSDETVLYLATTGHPHLCALGWLIRKAAPPSLPQSTRRVHNLDVPATPPLIHRRPEHRAVCVSWILPIYFKHRATFPPRYPAPQQSPLPRSLEIPRAITPPAPSPPALSTTTSQPNQPYPPPNRPLRNHPPAASHKNHPLPPKTP